MKEFEGNLSKYKKGEYLLFRNTAPLEVSLKMVKDILEVKETKTENGITHIYGYKK